MPDAAPGRRDLAAYGLLAMPLAFGGLPLYIHGPDFFATERGVPLAGAVALPLLLRGVAVTALIFLHRKGAI